MYACKACTLQQLVCCRAQAGQELLFGSMIPGSAESEDTRAFGAQRGPVAQQRQQQQQQQQPGFIAKQQQQPLPVFVPQQHEQQQQQQPGWGGQYPGWMGQLRAPPPPPPVSNSPAYSYVM